MKTLENKFRQGLPEGEIRQLVFGFLCLKQEDSKMYEEIRDLFIPEFLAKTTQKKQYFEEFSKANSPNREAFCFLAVFKDRIDETIRTCLMVPINTSLNIGEVGKEVIDVIDKNDFNFHNLYMECLRMFCDSMGRSGGEYYTPESVSKLFAAFVRSVMDERHSTLYDPTVGTGALLAAVENPNFHYYGVEIKPEVVKLARMFFRSKGLKNTILHADTLYDDPFADKKFDIIIANPPFSLKHDSTKTNINFDGIKAPDKCADWAFVKHMIDRHDKLNYGRIFTLGFPGMLFRGGKEAQIRKWIVSNCYLEAVIALPEKLFAHTSINTVLLVLRDGETANEFKEDWVLFMDLSHCSEKFQRGQDKLVDSVIEEAAKIYKNFAIDGDLQGEELSYEAKEQKKPLWRIVNRDQILESPDVNLSINRFINVQKKEELLTQKEADEMAAQNLASSLNILLNTIEIQEVVATFHDSERIKKIVENMQTVLKPFILKFKEENGLD